LSIHKDDAWVDFQQRDDIEENREERDKQYVAC
jgi:hypothetical protein